MKKETVAIVRCETYKQDQVDKAVRKALDLVDFKFKPKMKILIKPNAVGFFSKNQFAITTHENVVEAVCKYIKNKSKNCKIFVGDSSFLNTETCFEKTGLAKIAKKYGKLLIFEKEKIMKITNWDYKVLNNFELPKILKEVDLIIDMPKMKTHTLAKYTGAIKNYYGCIPGGLKQRLHLKAIGSKKFSKLIVDLYQHINKLVPELVVMDAIIGMEGEGPTSGEPRAAKLILASKNAVALDIAATTIMGFNPKKIPVIKEAVTRKLYTSFKFEPKLFGIEKVPNLKFKPSSQTMGIGKLKNFFKQKPIVCNHQLCTRCATCAKHCPVEAISMQPYPVIDKNICIRCFCCIEGCPEHALSLGKK